MRPFQASTRKGGGRLNGGGPVETERSFAGRARAAPSNTPSPASVSPSGLLRKRPSDSPVHGSPTRKRCRLSDAKISPLLQVSDRIGGGGSSGPGQRTPVIDLTGEPDDDAPQADSSDLKRRFEGSGTTILGSPICKAQSGLRYSRNRPLSPSTPAPGAGKKITFIDLSHIDDSEDDSLDGPVSPSGTRRGKTAQCGAAAEVMDFTAQKPAVPGLLFGRKRQRPDPQHEGAHPAGSAQKKGARVWVSPSVPMSGMAPRPAPIMYGSPGAPNSVTSPMKSASPPDDTKKALIASRSHFGAQNGQDDPFHPRRRYDPVLRLRAQNPDHDTRNVGSESRNGREKRQVEGTIEAGPNGIDADLDESLNLSKLDFPVRGPVTPKRPSLVLDIDRASDIGKELLSPAPRSSRRRNSKVVILRAKPDSLRAVAERRVQRPDIPLGECFLLTMLPFEVQECIFGYLLLAEDPIQVLHGWAKLYQRQRSNLHPAILSTCREIYNRAAQVLYSRNVFRYMVRDRPQAAEFPTFAQDINVARCTPLFRWLELKIERSRTGHAYCTSLANAIQLLNRHGADLHTLVLDVSPSVEGDTLSTVGYFYRNGEIVEALKALKTCFIEVRVFTPKTEDEPATSLRRKLDMRTELCHWEQQPGQPPSMQLDGLSDMITRACISPSNVIADGSFEEFEVVPHQNERRARPVTITYNNDDDDDDDDVDVEEDDDGEDGDDSGDFCG